MNQKIKETTKLIEKFSGELWDYAHVEDDEGNRSLTIEMVRPILKDISDKLNEIENESRNKRFI